jgi:hypothetical protein
VQKVRPAYLSLRKAAPIAAPLSSPPAGGLAVPVLTACASIPIARRSEIFCCAGGVLQFPDVDMHPRAGGSIRLVWTPAGSTRDECQRPASCGKVLEQSARWPVCTIVGTSRAAVVGGFPAGGLRRAAGADLGLPCAA